MCLFVCVCVCVCLQLPGVEACDRYTFRYGRNPLMEWPLAFNPSGSARSEPKACQTKRYRDPPHMFSTAFNTGGP